MHMILAYFADLSNSRHSALNIVLVVALEIVILICLSASEFSFGLRQKLSEIV